MPAEQEGLHLRAAPDVEDADALGGVELVAAHREQVNGRLLHVNGDLAGDLNRIRVQDRSPFLADRRDLVQREDNARLVVRVHDRDEDGTLPGGRDLAPEVVEVEVAEGIDAELDDLVPEGL